MSGKSKVNIIDEVNYEIDEVNYEIDEVNTEIDEANFEIDESSTNNDINYEVNIKEDIQENIIIKPAHFECTCPDFKFRGMACKHIFSVCQKFYPIPSPEVIPFQEINEPEYEPEKTVDVAFEDWVSAIRKVWDKHDQEDRNQITTDDLEEIVSAGIKRKSKIAMYDKCPIPGFELRGTNYS
ncbi:23993_t:CDS:2, partial [Gigaspora margarita]